MARVLSSPPERRTIARARSDGVRVNRRSLCLKRP
jgi:hypothetical protein